MKSKKAQVEVQFNWIYVSIAGAVILSIFVGIALKMNQNSKEQLASEAITYFDEIFTSVQASENTENEISLPGLDLEIESDNPICNHYSIEGTDRSQISIRFLPFFSPRIIKTRILSYALGWDMPFRVSYFIYMTSPGVAYVSVGNNAIRDELPEHLTVLEVNDASDLENENYDRIRFFTSEDPSSFNVDDTVEKNKFVSVIKINQEANEITYYKLKSGEFEEQDTTYYLDDTTLLAAIYADNVDSYNCNMAKAIERLHRFSTMLKNRASELRGADLLSLCSPDAYSQAESMLTQMEEATESTKMDASMVSQLKTIREQLSVLNKDLNKRSCPTVY
ncbi:hypothetical protein HN789_04540 [archaeon]|jgi:hypothetical protein|nr:hypothetical protein [archaeon]MBT6107471.1 hypothetical protein [Campylobacteraceae bacterium]MBT4022462.1 hypothetical protein [archaeon]MBT4272617.1 hypothetical protein [archaeon]MBT4461217.1 hypothetical protein [archaeon]